MHESCIVIHPMTTVHPIPSSRPSRPSVNGTAPLCAAYVPVSTSLESPAVIEADGSSSGLLPRSRRGVSPDGGARRLRVGIIGATGYVGSELIRLLSRHPNVEIAGLAGRDRHDDPIGGFHPHLASTGLTVGTELPDDIDAAFLALPHGAAAALVPEMAERGIAIIDLGPDFRLRDAADYPRWYGFEHPHPELLDVAVYGLPELHRDELRALIDAPVAIVGSPGCYPTATLLSLAPLARAGLIGDLVVDAKSGVSGAGRDPKPEMHFGEVDESVKAYGIGGHRHVAEIEQELAVAATSVGLDPGANPGAIGVDFVPHLMPMVRGILSTNHVRPTRPDQRRRARRRCTTRPTTTSRSCTSWPARRRPSTRPAATTSWSSRTSTSGPAGSWSSAPRTTWSRAPPARPSRPSTSSTTCRRRPGSSSSRSRHEPDRMTAPSIDPTIPDAGTDLPLVTRRATLPAGFRAGGLAIGIKASGRPDLALVRATAGPAAAAAVFTPNAFAAAPVRQSRANLAATSGDPRGGFGWATAVVSTSGCANAATGAAGDADQAEVGRMVSAATGVAEANVLHLSTGIIGTRLPLELRARRAGRPGAGRSATTTPGWRPPPCRCARPTR